MAGTSGDDTITATGGKIIGGAGDDTITLESGDNKVIGGAGDDTFIYAFANHIGTGTSNTIEGSSGINTLVLDLNDVPNGQIYAQNIYTAFQEYLAEASSGPFDVIQAAGMTRTDISFVVHNISEIQFNPIITNQDVSLNENTPLSTLVYDLDAYDPNPAETFTYSITAGNELGKFAIDSTTGEITLAGELDFESTTEPNPYELTVQVEDSTSLTAEMTLTVNVEDVGEYNITINNVAVNEADESATFTVTLSEQVKAGDSVTIDYETSDDSATAGEDYVATSGTLTFAPGEISKEIQVSLVDDVTVEGEENFFVNLSNAQAAIGTATIGEDVRGEGIITDNDVYTISIAPAESTGEVSESAGSAVFTVSLDKPVAADSVVTVDYKTVDGTAEAGSDYDFQEGKLTFSAGEQTQNVTVTLINDLEVEGPENFFVQLSNATVTVGPVAVDAANITPAIGEYTIVDNDVYNISINGPFLVNEGDGSVTFTVSLQPDVIAGDEVKVDYSTSDGTATAGEDYVATSGTLTFAPGEISKEIQVSLVDDVTVEGEENFFVNLSNAQAAIGTATIGEDAQGEGIITDNDVYTISIAPAESTGEVSESAGSAVFTVSLDKPVAADSVVTVDYKTVDGTAEAGSDYDFQEGKLTFSAGEQTQDVTVTLIDDLEVEGPENFFVQLSNATVNVGSVAVDAANIVPTPGECTIISDDVVANQQPTADAGPDQTVSNSADLIIVPVSLDGTGSSDPDGDPLVYNWSASGGSFDDPTSPTPVFSAGNGTYYITLEVSDGTATDTDEMIVEIVGGGGGGGDTGGGGGDTGGGIIIPSAGFAETADNILVPEEENVDLRDISQSNLEQVDMSQNTLPQTLTLSAEDVLRVGQTDQLIIKGSSADAVESPETWTSTGSTVIDSVTYNEYSSGGATLLIQDGVNVSGLID